MERGEYTRRLAMACGSDVRDVEAAVRRLARGDSAPDLGGEGGTPVRRATTEDRRFADIVQILLEELNAAAKTGGKACSRPVPESELRM